jgi:hypothetical protein
MLINRERWLLRGIDALRPLFADHDYQLPEVMVSCGFPSTGKRSRHVGQCWSRSASDRAVNQIFISPVLHEPVAVLDTLVHELVHAMDDCHSGHGKNFRRIAMAVVTRLVFVPDPLKHFTASPPPVPRRAVSD